jgi:hypothetical protein
LGLKQTEEQSGINGPGNKYGAALASNRLRPCQGN